MLGATTWHKADDVAQGKAGADAAVAVVRGGGTSGIRSMPSDQSDRDELANAFTPMPLSPDTEEDHRPLDLKADIEPPPFDSGSGEITPNQPTLPEGLPKP
ncbi:hypothetical protein ASG67_14105 [Sphingomonas sp. Leaf339]|uniref:hypothetical protein n=1 Tax=Sphingomonas sp. Leaf339 TaxID=1736343 RepID=UPI0007012A9C|nr:hypothetical protein [Sphingomonas sp. Leaf339]KQU47390.1 hypothetical protein ASG67_14105 [Sphingomonas sp. Leaf339]